ncbi:XRE family transcriptional regulator [Acidaminococcus provencensis]|uniref:XRE family transcriptional regulator n=1 Tax=Acidaminococcus provencensis TaxID=2058289 RepID=UPI000CF9D6C7|nr:XRE family transcriptional regulator [Acidaminococcus provencensis]
MFDKALFKYTVEKKQQTLESVAAHIGINPATLYRKMSGISDFNRKEIQEIKEFLVLSDEESNSIFFA